MSLANLLSKERTIAELGFNRWLVPPAALAIHLCIGMAYGFSVFWLPLSRAVGITAPIACSKEMSFFAEIMATDCDWKISSLVVMFQLFFIFLGGSAFVLGRWLEHVGPRKAGVAAAFCWCGGLVISALGVHLHQIWLMWLGAGVIGGIGLGIGYISPVSTLIKWFPDRRGMATGMAIMGFGGGAMVGAPLADWLMRHYASATSVGVWETFLTMAVIYFVFMLAGAFAYRIPAAGWKPAGWTASQTTNTMITNEHVHVSKAWLTPQFWLIWAVLCLNVTAGIGILGMASPLLQEVFAGQLIGLDLGFNELSLAQKAQIATIAAGFTGMLSLFNIGGRFFWASLSDHIGRKMTYMAFFLIGMALYTLIPTMGKHGHLAFFVLSFCIILSMYGGGFSTVPAYLADMFGSQMVGAIHGRLLTAWSVAGVLGTMVVNYIREYQLSHGVAKAQAYDVTMYVLAAMLVLGLVCNSLVRPVDKTKFMSEKELEHERQLSRDKLYMASPVVDAVASSKEEFTHPVKVIIYWSVVGIPLLIGFWMTLQKATLLFK